MAVRWLSLARYFSLLVTSIVLAGTSMGVGIPGDYNQDGYVNAEDAAIWASEYGSISNLADGNGDFIVDQADYDLVFADLGNESPTNTDTTPASLLYVAATGSVTLDQTNAIGNKITAFKLLSSTSDFIAPGVANFPYQLTATGAPFDGSSTSVDTLAAIGQIDINQTGFPTAQFLMGSILPPGLTESELNVKLADSFYLDSAGGRNGFNLVVIAIPEPSALVLLLAALAIVASTRSRQAAS